jgi:hypothetical protein
MNSPQRLVIIPGVSIQTRDRLAQQTGLSKIEVIHLTLRQLANRCLPKYGMDDGPLTDAHIESIRAQTRQADSERVFQSRSF